jgi:hypothetical protein
VGEVIEFADFVRRRRRRSTQQLHGRCLLILEDAVAAAQIALAGAQLRERAVCVARLRKLEDLHEYASALG